MAWADCISRISAAAGRVLSDEEASAIFERIHKAALDIKAGRVDPVEVGLGKLGDSIGVGQSQDQFIQAVAKRAAGDLIQQAEQAERQAYLQITTLAARQRDVAALRAAGLDEFKSARGLIARDYSGVANVESFEQRLAGWRAELRRQITPVWDALGDDWLGFFQDRDKMLLLVRELRGEKTGDAMAAKGAKAFHDAAEAARKAFNANGGNIGRLDDWGMPQHHSQLLVAQAGKDAWIDYVMPKLDRARYVDDLGQAWSDPQLRDFLGKAWETIATNGIANLAPGRSTGIGKRANRHAESRQIHFKNAESVIEYWQQFGEKSLVEIIDGHIEVMARDIALLEKFGPNPDITYRTLRDQAMIDAAKTDPTKTETAKKAAEKLDTLYNAASGKTKPTSNPTFSNIMDGIASLNVAGKLGGAVIPSLFGDKVLFEAVSHLNNIPAMQRWQTELSLLNPANAADRRMLLRQGLMLDYLRGGLNRFADNLGVNDAGGGWSAGFKNVTGKFANAVMRMSGMNAINEIRKGAFGLTLMDAIGHEISVGKAFKDLDKSDVRALRTFGVSESDWKVWQLAKLEDMGTGNSTTLTPEAIAKISDADLAAAKLTPESRQAAIVKLLGVVNTETEFAITTPGLKERAQLFGGAERGTVKGEIWRAAMQFKSFPWAFFQRSMDLVANANGPAGKALMVSYLLTATTAAGAMILQTREVLSGKDPAKMMDDKWYKFWIRAFLQGGAIGIYGDFINSVNQTRYGTGPLEVFAGPTIGPLLELGVVQPLNAIKAAAEGKETHLGAQTLQDLKGFLPFNNLWYSKAAIDHLVWQRVMESLSPGYLGSIRSKTMKEYGQDWWWAPGEVSPDRAPDFSRAFER